MRKKRISYLNTPSLFDEFKNQTDNEIKSMTPVQSTEIVTRQAAFDFYALFQDLPNPDPILKKLGKSNQVYEELRYDTRVNAVVENRKSAVLCQNWELTGSDEVLKELYLQVVNDWKMHDIMAEILDAVLYGYKPIEIIWEKQGAFILPIDIVGKPPRWFKFDPENRLRFLTKQNQTIGELVPDNKIFCATNQATYDNPYGYPVLAGCFWPVTFRKSNYKFWMTFLEKYGMPFIKAEAPEGAKETEISNIADMLDNMVQDAIAVTPSGYKIDIWEASKTSSSQSYKMFLDAINAEITLAVLGTNLTTEVTGGSYAAAKAHMGVRDDIIEGDTRIIEDTINHIFDLTTEMNFSGKESPRFNLYYEQEIDKTRSERDNNLKNQGVKFTEQYFKEHYNLKETDFILGEPTVVKPNPFQSVSA